MIVLILTMILMMIEMMIENHTWNTDINDHAEVYILNNILLYGCGTAWNYNQVCDMINEYEDGAEMGFRAIRKR